MGTSIPLPEEYLLHSPPLAEEAKSVPGTAVVRVDAEPARVWPYVSMGDMVTGLPTGKAHRVAREHWPVGSNSLPATYKGTMPCPYPTFPPQSDDPYDRPVLGSRSIGDLESRP